MSTAESIELIVAVFERNENRADEMLQEIQQLAADQSLDLKAAAVIVKTQEGKIVIDDQGDVDAKHGGVFGALSGALIGLLGGGPIGAVAGAVAGAAAGGIAADKIDLGVPNKMIKEIKQSLQPGSSALIVYAELGWVDWVVAALAELGATVRHETIEADVLNTLTRRLGQRSNRKGEP